jgi:hypothetical protein
MSVGRNLGIGGFLITLAMVVRYVIVPVARMVWSGYRDQDAEQRERHQDLDRIDTYHAVDRAKYFERMTERARASDRRTRCSCSTLSIGRSVGGCASVRIGWGTR